MIEEVLRKGKDFLENFSISNFLGNIGAYGNIPFSTLPGFFNTPESIQLNISSKLEEHENLGNIPYTEFSHRNLRSISMSIKLISVLVDIDSALLRLHKICELGEHYPLIIGGKPLGENDFILTSIDQGIKSTDSKGDFEIVTCSLSFKEYNPRIDRILLPAPNKLTESDKNSSAVENNTQKKVKDKKKNNKILKKANKKKGTKSNHSTSKWKEELMKG